MYLAQFFHFVILYSRYHIFSSHSYSSLLLSYIVHHVLVKLTVILTIIEVIRMDLNLRKAILSNIAENDQEQLEATIVDAVQQGEEKMLPGLGVLFELIWKQSGDQEKQEMVDALEQGVKQASS